MLVAHTSSRARTVLNLLVLACLVAFAFAIQPNGTVSPPPKGNGTCPDIIGGSVHGHTAPQATEIERTCGGYDTADKANSKLLADYWRKWTSEYRDGRCPVPARTCRRFACWNTSGLYLCNDNDHAIDVRCADGFDRFAKLIAYGCCRKDRLLSPGGSGQIVTDQGYRVVVAYANCRHGRDDDVPGAGGQNPNGKCRTGTPQGGPCDSGSEKNCAIRKRLWNRFVGGYY